MNRRALLIGAAQYGEGFVPLPAVAHDLEAMREALRNCGYEVSVAAREQINTATPLDTTIRDFCRKCGPNDIHLIYFSGHGLLIDRDDCIVPEGTSRADAIQSRSQRVSTDLSLLVQEQDTGLILFIVDACRDGVDAPVAKGSGWGDPEHLKIPAEHHFIRFFGCSPGQVCQVLPKGWRGKDISIFSKALADVLAESKHGSLNEVLERVQKRCDELTHTGAIYGLSRQNPRLSCGEASTDLRAILETRIFGASSHPDDFQVWNKFDPTKLHCLVIGSEHEWREQRHWDLKHLVRNTLARDNGERIWKAFQKYWAAGPLLSGEMRGLNQKFEPSATFSGYIGVTGAFAGSENFTRAVRCVIEADLVVFDVTKFEPGVMLLVGIRAACRRGVSICSYGGGWHEGEPIDVPFNLQDLSLISHSPAGRAGDSPVLGRFVDRVESGFEQLLHQPRYLDLPAYDALRQMGSRYEASSTIDAKERVLVLCSFKDDYYQNWEYIRDTLGEALWQKNIRSKILRLIDLGTPRLISQALYEQIRRSAGCVMDWSEFSPSAFLELGVRLAASNWGVVQIIDERYLPGRPKAPDLTQIGAMQGLLKPIVFGFRSETAPFEEMAQRLISSIPHLSQADDERTVHQIAWQTIPVVEQDFPEISRELGERADSLHHPDQTRDGAPQILFYSSQKLKERAEEAALERRIAAWLYLEHRMKARDRADGDPLKKLFLDIGDAAAKKLYQLGGDADFDLADYITKLIS